MEMEMEMEDEAELRAETYLRLVIFTLLACWSKQLDNKSPSPSFFWSPVSSKKRPRRLLRKVGVKRRKKKMKQELQVSQCNSLLHNATASKGRHIHKHLFRSQQADAKWAITKHSEADPVLFYSVFSCCFSYFWSSFLIPSTSHLFLFLIFDYQTGWVGWRKYINIWVAVF